MDKAEIKKACENCRFYSRHFIKYSTRYISVFCGHCLHGKNRKMRPVLCEFWEHNAAVKSERRQSIKEMLAFFAERLDEIAMILKDDEENN